MQVFFFEEAALELDQSVLYYSNVYKKLGLDFEREVKKLIKRIKREPKLFQLHEDGTRRVSTKRFPFKLEG